MVSHGHITVNGKRITVPSHKVKVGDTIGVREGSKNSGLFTTLADDHVAGGIPSWLSFDLKGLQGEKRSEPMYVAGDTLFDPELILEYYSR
jgi:small subunit ribosomal protein S4